MNKPNSAAIDSALNEAIAKEKLAKDAKRAKRTGLQYEYYQPRPDHIRANGDCVMRAFTWALGLDYEEVLKELQEICDEWTQSTYRRNRRIKDSGAPLNIIQTFAKRHGWEWKAVKGTDYQRRRTLFKAENLPRKLCVAITTRHAVAVEDHVCLDSYDSRGDRSCVLEGFFVKKD